MAKVIEFPSGVDLVVAKAAAGKHSSAEQALYKLARFYVDMNHITSGEDIFIEGGRIPLTALDFVEQVCETIGYHKGKQTTAPEGGGDAA